MVAALAAAAVAGGEPVTWIVLHWQRCTEAPAAVATAALVAKAATAATSAAPQMQKMWGADCCCCWCGRPSDRETVRPSYFRKE